MDVKVEKRDIVKPGLGKELDDGDHVVFTDIRVVTKRVKAETIDFDTIEREDSSMLEGKTDVIRAGEKGSRDVTYKRTFRNGKLVATKVVTQKVLDAPRDQIVAVGTKEGGAGGQLRVRRHRLGPARCVRVRRQLGDQHRQRLLRRPAVLAQHLAVVRR